MMATPRALSLFVIYSNKVSYITHFGKESKSYLFNHYVEMISIYEILIYTLFFISNLGFARVLQLLMKFVDLSTPVA